MGDLFDEHSGAVFSDDKKYRYRLWRIWDEQLPKAMCIGLNPSNADADNNDPTITNLIYMLQILGYGGFYMMNLFAFISSKPEDLLTCDDPLGDNDKHLDEVEKLCDKVIVCWGAFKSGTERIKQVLPKYPQALCFGINANGTPFHPLAMMYKGFVKNPKLTSYSKYLAETEIQKQFILYVRDLIQYWKNDQEKDHEEKLNSFAFSLLAAIDGEAVGLPGFAMVPLTDEPMVFECDISGSLHDLLFDYKKIK